uniref:KASH domain-containing protein n=1 Tax=Monopterus albus TaxID=43700 RepID=A0A3Q3J124_MONAL
MTQQEQQEFTENLEAALCWMQAIQERLKANDSTQGPRDALEARLRETEKIRQSEHEGSVKIDMALAAAENLLQSADEELRSDTQAKIKDLKSLWEETCTYIIHCHSRIEWVWLHWCEYLKAYEEFELWLMKQQRSLDAEVEMQVGVKEKLWLVDQQRVVVSDIHGQAVLLERLLDEAAALHNRTQDPSVEPQAQDRLQEAYNDVRDRAEERLSLLQKIAEEHQTYQGLVQRFQSWLLSKNKELTDLMEREDTGENKLKALQVSLTDTELCSCLEESQVELLKAQLKELFRFSEDSRHLSDDVLAVVKEHQRYVTGSLPLLKSRKAKTLWILMSNRQCDSVQLQERFGQLQVKGDLLHSVFGPERSDDLQGELTSMTFVLHPLTTIYIKVFPCPFPQRALGEFPEKDLQLQEMEVQGQGVLERTSEEGQVHILRDMKRLRDSWLALHNMSLNLHSYVSNVVYFFGNGEKKISEHTSVPKALCCVLAQALRTRLAWGQEHFQLLLQKSQSSEGGSEPIEDVGLEELRYRWMLYKSKLKDVGEIRARTSAKVSTTYYCRKPGLLQRVCWLALPLWLLLLALLLLAFLLPLMDEGSSCSLSNNFAWSFNIMLRYDGPPPT